MFYKTKHVIIGLGDNMETKTSQKRVDIVKVVYFFITVWLIGALTFLSISVVSNNNVETVAIDATITKIEKVRDYSSDRNYSHVTYVTYTVDNVNYENPISEYVSSFEVGKTITVYYEKDHPENLVKTQSMSIIYYILLSVFGICLVVVIILFIRYLKKQKFKPTYA